MGHPCYPWNLLPPADPGGLGAPPVQVCSYRCITSYESPQLADFSLCILQKHNCLGLSAEIPMVSHYLVSSLQVLCC